MGNNLGLSIEELRLKTESLNRVRRKLCRRIHEYCNAQSGLKSLSDISSRELKELQRLRSLTEFHIEEVIRSRERIKYYSMFTFTSLFLAIKILEDLHKLYPNTFDTSNFKIEPISNSEKSIEEHIRYIGL